MEVFSQTIRITIMGMGLTFAAVGVLVIAMIVLTRWARGPAEATMTKHRPSGAIPVDKDLEDIEQAAAVAVAVALAQAARRIHPARTWHSAGPEEDLNPWQAYTRGQQLDQRKTHQTLRW